MPRFRLQFPGHLRVLLSGVLAGSATSVGFAALHQWLISDIWFSLGPMMVAGALCGLCLAWSYHVVFAGASAARWVFYNLEFIGLFALLGLVSFVVYEPVYTIPGLIAGVESPDALLSKALPLSAAFGLLAGVALSLIRGRTLRKATAITVTCVVLSLLVGHNAAVLGLVYMTKEAMPLLAEFYGLLTAIMLGNAATFLVLEWLGRPRAARGERNAPRRAAVRP
jgi:hypothetical protein